MKEEMPQITYYKGRNILVELPNGDRIKGTLVFYNWDGQVIHMSDCVHIITKNQLKVKETEAEFLILNKNNWTLLKVTDEE